MLWSVKKLPFMFKFKLTVVSLLICTALNNRSECRFCMYMLIFATNVVYEGISFCLPVTVSVYQVEWFSPACAAAWLYFKSLFVQSLMD